MISLWNVGTLRDYWPRPDAASIENVEWLQKVDCFRPKFYAVPIQGAIDIAANGYIVNTLAMVPGAWLLGFSHVNPVAFDLYFERFLNSGRNDPPDIDLDFDSRRRDEVLSYVLKKYGRGSEATGE